MGADTSWGATITLATSTAFAAAVKPNGIEVTGAEIGVLPTETLATTDTKTAILDDLKERQKMSVDIFYDPDKPPPVGVPQLTTLTYPIPAGKTNGATKVGTGAIVRERHSLQMGALMKGTYDLEWLGAVVDTASS